MTVIVGVEGKDGACLAADSFLGNIRWKAQSPNKQLKKIFKRDAGDHEMIFGITGSLRWAQLLEYRLAIPKIKTDDIQRYMATDFSERIRQTLDNYGFKRSFDGRDFGGTALVVYKGQLFTIQQAFDVIKMDNYDAVGYGIEVALGAVYARYMDDMSKEATITVARTAVEAAAHHSPLCSLPVDHYWSSNA